VSTQQADAAGVGTRLAGPARFEACVVTYNSEDAVERLVRSLVTEPALAAIRVFDNASSDGTVDRLTRLTAGSPVPLVVTASSENLGFPAGCNRLLRAVESEVAVFVNPDVEMREGALSELAELVHRDDSIGIATCGLRTRDGRVQSEPARPTPTLTRLVAQNAPQALRHAAAGRTRARHCGDRPSRLETDHDVECTTGALMVFPTDLRHRVGYMDESVFMYLEDLDWCARVRRSGLRIRYLGSRWAWHESGASASSHQDHLFALMPQVWLTYFRRYGSFFARRLARPVLVALTLSLAAGSLLRGRRPYPELRALRQALTYRPRPEPEWS
jgi:N-acetylglucosaminyl-diphospho-decaprenol L-rhamnosyltransferase